MYLELPATTTETATTTRATTTTESSTTTKTTTTTEVTSGTKIATSEPTMKEPGSSESTNNTVPKGMIVKEM